MWHEMCNILSNFSIIDHPIFIYGKYFISKILLFFYILIAEIIYKIYKQKLSISKTNKLRYVISVFFFLIHVLYPVSGSWNFSVLVFKIRSSLAKFNLNIRIWCSLWSHVIKNYDILKSWNLRSLICVNQPQKVQISRKLFVKRTPFCLYFTRVAWDQLE